jgi:RHS repeat-associated protein
LLRTKADGRGVSCTNTYDDRLRVTTNTYAGSLPEQNLTTTWQYDPRGFATNITEQFASTNTGPATTLLRSYDAYGQLASESVNVGGSAFSSTSQSWDAAGRRSALSFNSQPSSINYSYGWRADGMLASASDSAGSGAYSYDTAGLLASRIVGNRVTGITSRDGEGRPLSIATTVNALTQLTETLAWSGDGLLASHTLARADFTDSRAYAYANLSRRLAQEQLNLNVGTTWTNTLVYDQGITGGPGVLTSAGQLGQGSALWSGGTDVFSRVSAETNNTAQSPAYGHANGPATFSAWLDNHPVSVSANGTNATQWRAMMELAPGTHQLTVSALQPNGQFTAWATNSFTNNIAYLATADTYDNAGNITNRVWKNPGGAVERTQALSWDARGRLHQVIERGTNNSGYNWTATYDGLNRRLSTTSILVTNNVAFNSQPSTINQYYDPLVEFLELGVSYGTNTEWKLYGPDLNGRYGGLNGTGGFDAVSPALNTFNPTISDMRGNILAVVTNGVVSWNPSRTTGYGAVPGYRPLALGNGASIALSSAWRGRWVDITGYYQIGLRPYDPVSGQWLTFDSVWNGRDLNYYTFVGGDPINGFDADGRVIIQQWQQTQQNLINSGGFWNNAAAYGISFGITAFNAFSFGNFSKNDLLADQNLAGQISDSQFWAGASLNTGIALTSLAAGGGAGSLATRAVTATGSKVLTSIAAGSAAGFGASATDVALTRAEYAGLDLSYPGTVSSDLLNVGFSTVVGGGLGSLQAFAPTPEGVVYLRTDENDTLGDYVGQAKSEERFEVRQGEHQDNFPNADFNFDVLAQAEPGDELSFMEEYNMRQLGGAQSLNPNTPLSNTIRAMNDVDFANYMFDVPQIPTSLGGAYQPGPLGGKH